MDLPLAAPLEAAPRNSGKMASDAPLLPRSGSSSGGVVEGTDVVERRRVPQEIAAGVTVVDHSFAHLHRRQTCCPRQAQRCR